MKSKAMALFGLIDTPTSLCQDSLMARTSPSHPSFLSRLATARTTLNALASQLIGRAGETIRREFDRSGRLVVITSVDCEDCGQRQDAELGICSKCGSRSSTPAGAPNAWVRRQYEDARRAEILGQLLHLEGE